MVERNNRIPDIYGFKRNFRKSDATTVGASSHPDAQSTFSEPLTSKAMKKRKILSQGFSESALKSAEGIDSPERPLLRTELMGL